MTWLKQKQLDITQPEVKEEEEAEEEIAICIKCKHHKEEDGEHKCYANVTEEIDYVTGEKTLNEVEDCSDVNDDGNCSDYERKD